MKRKQLLFALGAIVIVVAMVFAGPKFINTNSKNANVPTNGAVAGEKISAKATLAITNGTDKKTFDQDLSTQINALDFTKSIASQKGITLSIKSYSFGDMIEGIGDTKADGTNFWGLYVNDKMSDVGASDYIVKSGDTIEWRFGK